MMRPLCKRPDERAASVLRHRAEGHVIRHAVDQNGGRTAAVAAFSIGPANPMPMNVRAGVGLRMAVTMPTTSPAMVTSGPPELPGLAAASNWIRLLISCLPSAERNERFSPEPTPAKADGPMP